MTIFPAELFISLHNKHVYTTRKILKIVWHDLLHWICQQKHMWKKLQWFPFHLKPTDIICIYVAEQDYLRGTTGGQKMYSRGTLDEQQRYNSALHRTENTLYCNWILLLLGITKSTRRMNQPTRHNLAWFNAGTQWIICLIHFRGHIWTQHTQKPQSDAFGPITGCCLPLSPSISKASGVLQNMGIVLCQVYKNHGSPAFFFLCIGHFVKNNFL